MGRKKLFSDEPEPVSRYLRAYNKDWVGFHMKKTDQISRP